MNHKIYRICLLSVVILAIVGGIFYYLNYVKDKSDITEGTLVGRDGESETQGASVLQRLKSFCPFQSVKTKASGAYASRELKESGNTLHRGPGEEDGQEFWGAYL